MTPAVEDKFKEGDALYRSGNVQLLPLLKAIKENDSVTANSTEYKQLVKAIDEVENGKAPSNKNKDGFIGGQEISEKDYFILMAKRRQKK